jgi:hypothetical protein
MSSLQKENGNKFTQAVSSTKNTGESEVIKVKENDTYAWQVPREVLVYWGTAETQRERSILKQI